MLSKGSSLIKASINMNKDAAAKILMQKSSVYLHMKWKKFSNSGGFNVLSP
jgi:hypothetical protein